MLECDANLLTSHLAGGFAWFVRLHFLMLAYVHVLRCLRGCPLGSASSPVWRVLGDSYEEHAAEPKLADAIFVVCSRLILQAWEARGAEMAKLQQEEPELVPDVPRIVSDMRDSAVQLDAAAASPGGGNLAQRIDGLGLSGYNGLARTFGCAI